MSEQLMGIEKVMRGAYYYFDNEAQKVQDIAVANGMKIPCRPGCAYCCNQLTAVTLTEAVLVAGAILRKGNKELGEQIERLGDHARISCKLMRNVFDRGISCPLLLADKTCSVYAERPSVCRYLIALGDASSCVPPSNVASYLNLMHLQLEVIKHYYENFSRLGTEWSSPVFGPLSLMVLHSLRLYGDSEARTLAIRALKGCEDLQSVTVKILRLEPVYKK